MTGPTKVAEGEAAIDLKEAAKPPVAANKAPAAPKPVALPSSMHPEHPRQVISLEKLDSMSPPEIRAVAGDRGYDLGQVYSRGALKFAFLKAQEADKSLHRAK